MIWYVKQGVSVSVDAECVGSLEDHADEGVQVIYSSANLVGGGTLLSHLFRDGEAIYSVPARFVPDEENSATVLLIPHFFRHF